MKKGFWKKRIPTLLAFLVLFVSVWVTSFLLKNQAVLVGRGASEKSPQQVTISNVTDSSFTASFTTDQQAVSAISVMGQDNIPYVVFDDRDKVTGSKTPFYSHLVTVSNLTPQTSYKFTILSDGEIYPKDGTTYSVTTGRALGKETETNIISGKVILLNGNGADDTIVTFGASGAQTLSTLTNHQGEYKINVGGARASDLKSFFKDDASSSATLKFARGNLTSSVMTLLKDANQIPPVSLSYQYDFTQIQSEEISTASSILRTPSQAVKYGDIKIINPRKDASFIDARPIFSGTAIPNQSVKITIESKLIETTVISGINGYWSFRPSAAIPPGNHKITIQTLDQYGIMRTITSNFVVFAGGTQVAESATPSATPIATSTPIPTATPIPTIIIPSPTISVIVSTPTATLTPAPTVVLPTTIPTRPPIVTPAPTGNISSVVLTIFSAILISGGAALLFLL